jgi:hypothetical protein
MKDEVFDIFLKSMFSATSLIEEEYFNLPVAYDVVHIARERNYCYELYHLIKNNFPKLGYTFSGEIDKAGHELITPICGRITPDFLLHRPGNMGPDDNHTIIEVKTFTGATTNNEGTGFLKDIRTINCMQNLENGYYRGVLLVFGYTTQAKKDELRNVFKERCNIETTRLIFHEAPNTQAYLVD